MSLTLSLLRKYKAANHFEMVVQIVGAAMPKESFWQQMRRRVLRKPPRQLFLRAFASRFGYSVWRAYGLEGPWLKVRKDLNESWLMATPHLVFGLPSVGEGGQG